MRDLPPLAPHRELFPGLPDEFFMFLGAWIHLQQTRPELRPMIAMFDMAKLVQNDMVHQLRPQK